MVRPPCCDKEGVKKGPWTPEEDLVLVSYIQEHGPGNWRAVPTRTASYLPERTDNDIKNFWNTHLKRKLQGSGDGGEGDGGEASKPATQRLASSSKGQWERQLQTDIDMARRALREALTSIHDVKPQPDAAGGAGSLSGAAADSPASSSSGASQCSPSSAGYVLTTANISRMLDGWARKGGRPSSGPATPAPAESASASSEASEVSYGVSATLPVFASAFEYETKPSVTTAPDQTQLSAIESWLFADVDGVDHHGQGGSLLDAAMDYAF
ncbi:hypothetical protein ABZP36_001516 [Zizania latifolia]